MTLDFINGGDVLSLTNNPNFDLINIDGQTSASSSLSSIVIGGIDGDMINSAQAVPRTIILDLRIKQNVNVEAAKMAILKIVKIKRNCSLLWNQNNRELTISGIVESVEMPRWNNSVTMQISIHCEQPFWEDVRLAVEAINEAINLHYFTESPDDMLYFPDEGIPFGEYDTSRTRSFYNDGDVSVGMDIEIIAFDTVTNPIIRGVGGFFGIGHGTGAKEVVMNSGDVIRISTHKGNKSVKLNGVSLLGKIKPQSTWLQLEAGENTFSVDSDDISTTNMTFNILYKQRYI